MTLGKSQANPEKEVKFRWKAFVSTSSETIPDVMSLLAIAFSMVGLLMKMRVMAWQALVCVLVGLASSNSAALDAKQVISSVMIVGMGLVMAYLGPASRQFTNDLWLW